MSDHHHHHHKQDSNLTFEEKLQTLIAHWIDHNKDHAKNYQSWADKTRDEGKEDIAQLLTEVSEMTLKINEKFDKALSLLR